MRLNSKGQVTIPAEIRHKCGWRPGDEVDVLIDEDGAVRIVRRQGSLTRGQRATRRLRGTATTRMSTDEIMELLRGE
ncbi:AbrB/MazE/SpoVT family DNA-binding domain-containing protein [Streptomyces sp. RB6PN25]|uniref:AbrB/MazE/SpoVT family DNA-binding domain-containing protein n=1 Tax=Streptomyces humicola TaxID=2953240 RepID=A0ABT1PV57_9ACTN|nr:AbrB/MazE/SpoVT family DNA-binding domain-containing protein [Streptomyces humicola]MCQ4081559.1 AbrB/MazE/SpoVT family DNA-binding domain-containing protein [Streptomyces humicola]